MSRAPKWCGLPLYTHVQVPSSFKSLSCPLEVTSGFKTSILCRDLWGRVFPPPLTLWHYSEYPPCSQPRYSVAQCCRPLPFEAGTIQVIDTIKSSPGPVKMTCLPRLPLQRLRHVAETLTSVDPVKACGIRIELRGLGHYLVESVKDQFF